VRVVIQRVAKAAVHIRGETVAAIGPGLLVYAAFTADDGERDLAWMAEKIAHLRIFEDGVGKMNRSVLETGGEVLAVSQFTLYGDARKGRRPGFDLAAPAEIAHPHFARFVAALAAQGLPVRAGQFQETMQVESINDGPVTILLDSPASAQS
jgi:D-tyrosyl-tRNA(Tyr) deacylase